MVPLSFISVPLGRALVAEPEPEAGLVGVTATVSPVLMPDPGVGWEPPPPLLPPVLLLVVVVVVVPEAGTNGTKSEKGETVAVRALFVVSTVVVSVSYDCVASL